MDSTKLFSLNSGRPFSLWLDPARWPVSPLRLPGKCFTLWQNPACWPVLPLRLPGRGFTLWQDPAGWPVNKIRLPGKGFSLWLDANTWPVPPAVSAPPPPCHAEEVPQVAEVAEVAEVVVLQESEPQDVSVQPLAEPAQVQREVVPPAADSKALPATKSLMIAQNKSFTLWTRPGQVVAIPMQNGLSAAQTAALVLAHATPGHSGGTKPLAEATPAITAAAVPPSLAERWLPLAAAVLAVWGLNTLVKVADSKKTAGSESEMAQLRSQMGEAAKGLESMKASLAAETQAFAGKTAAIQAKLTAAEERNALLLTDLAKVTESGRKSDAKAAEQESRIQSLSGELAKAKMAASTASTAAEKIVLKITEEASLAKRESGAALVGLREALAKAEEEKAAALKAAAEAAAALSALQANPATPKAAP